MIPYAPCPVSGRSSAIGSASAGRPMSVVNGEMMATITSMPPEALNMPTTPRMAGDIITSGSRVSWHGGDVRSSRSGAPRTQP